MRLQLETEPTIENLRNHPAEMVEELRALLLAGAPANPDPHRNDFYEVENCSKVYYIHLSPVSGKVMFLAVWNKDGINDPLRQALSAESLACCATC